ncbi:glycosyltransferase family 39 protein [Siculibacillus lacustris]|uniref:Glycosyltransferase family 39 protein n=1 Tax=Siculibacillus lacustris TaxID=1549641 RepID=A0A4Q9VP32_9HYPH|nr:glycosyltransferase family 39 protein [Siculibacillus lacustris]TBW37220.1 glycosyltransferase family 39 protein [Siculibacillus lacustris]
MTSPAVPRLPPRRLIAALLMLTAVRLVFAAVAGSTDDEAYYRLWSTTLQAGYYDHAPMVAWVIRAGRVIAGDGTLGMRLFAPSSTLVGSLLLWRTVALAEGPTIATRAVLWFNATILIGAGSVLITPDTPSVFFWGVTLWALAELAASREPGWWLVVGAAAGLGLASKYSVLFLGLGMLVWLAGVRSERRWFGSWQLWAGGALALALFAPVIAWNAAHEWMSFAKQFGRTVPHGLRPEKLFEFLGVQMLLIGLPMVPFVGLGSRRAYRAWRAGEALRALPLATSLPFLAYLLFHSLHGGIEGNWPAPLYAAGAWMAAAAVGELGPAQLRLRKLAAAVAPIGFGLGALLYVHASLPILVLSPERDPTAQMRGWDAFAAAVDARARAVGAAWIAVPTYATVGQFALRLGPERVLQLGERARWTYLPPPDPALVAQPALYVARVRRDPIDAYRDRFRSVENLGTIDRVAGGRVVDTYALWRLADPIGAPLR